MRKTSRASKRLHGTLKKNREPKPGTLPPPAKVGPPPAHFNAAQRRAWLELAPQVQRTFADSDRAAFALLCKLWAHLETPATKKGAPAYVQASIIARVTALLESFGCTPASRVRVEQASQFEPLRKPVDEGQAPNDAVPLFGPGLGALGKDGVWRPPS